MYQANSENQEMHALKITVMAILLLIAGAVLYVIRQMSRLPDNSVKQFLQGGRRPRDAQVVVCLGASIVQGRVGASFMDLLAHRFDKGYRFVNAGVNGDTSYHVLQRLGQVIECEPDYVVILAGNNDVTGTLDPGAWQAYRGEKRLPRQPDVEWYRDNLQSIVGQLKEKTKAKIALCSLPVMGEELESVPNRLVARFNMVIKEIAVEEGVAYVPVYEREAAFLAGQATTSGRTRKQAPPYTGEPTQSLRLGFLANLEHYLLGRSYDAISRRNGMLLKVDYLHSNSREAAIIAGAIGEFLQSG